MKKKIILVLLALGFISLPFIFYKVVYTSPIIFLGDSHTYRFPFRKIFWNPKIKNRGVNGSLAKGVYDRLNTGFDYPPDKVFIMVGINDLNRDTPMDTTVYYYDLTIKKIKASSPETKIFVQSVLPVITANEYGYSNKSVIELNKRLKLLSEEDGVTYIDLYPHFEVNGQIKPEYVITDGLHLSYEGYKLWADLIKQYL